MIELSLVRGHFHGFAAAIYLLEPFLLQKATSL